MTPEDKTPKRKRRAPTAKRKTDAKTQAQTLIGVVEATAITIAGPEAALQPIEHQLIDDPLAAVLARVEPAALDRANSIMAPVLLACGLALYGARVYGLVSAQQAPALEPAGHRHTAPTAEPTLTPVDGDPSKATLRPAGKGGK